MCKFKYNLTHVKFDIPKYIILMHYVYAVYLHTLIISIFYIYNICNIITTHYCITIYIYIYIWTSIYYDTIYSSMNLWWYSG